MTAFIPVNTPLLDGNERYYLNECIDSAWVSSEGPFVRQFEEQMAARIARKYGIAVSNGSAALDTAVAALEIGMGDEVIMPAFTIISCVLPIVRSGAVPVLVDSDPLTWNMDVAQIEAKITAKTKAIMAVHIYGLPVDMDPLLDIAQRHGLRVIEDAAQMHGQQYRGKACGSFGDISTFSFYPNKLICAGEGGMVLTDDARLAERCNSLRNLCFQADKRFVHEELGWNFRMTNMQAALGVAQLERLDEFLLKKRAMGARYDALFASVDGVQLPLAKSEYAESIYWVYGLVLDEVHGDAAAMMKMLATLGVGTRPFFCPMHQQPVLLEQGLFDGEHYPVAERLYRQGFYIPSGLGLTNEEIDLVGERVREVLT